MRELSFGNWLRRQRKTLDLTREELAQRVGYSAATIRKIEDEERRPSVQLLERLAEIFSLPQTEMEAFRKFARGDWRAALGEDWATVGTGKATTPWKTTPVKPRTNLPPTVTSLIGREQDTAAVVAYLLNEEIRLVTLTGPLGVGKTRLSLQAARQVVPNFADGVFFVPLASLQEAEMAAHAAIQALGYVETRQCPALDQLIEGIADKQMLVVLDNCEHLIEGIAPLVAAVLLSCPNLKLLTSSREALRVPGEWVYPVPPLTMPPSEALLELEAAGEYPALMLFSERARAVRADFRLDGNNLTAVKAICARLDGLPLAIELIAARMRLMSPQSLLERLSDQSILSADGMRGVEARQKSLHNAIDWSYSLLSQEEKQVFSGLAVFSGSFTPAAVEALFAGQLPEGSASGLVSSLIDKSLVQQTWEAGSEPRFYMLFTIKQFALQRLQEMGMETSLRQAHLVYFLDRVEQADREFHGPNQLAWIDWVEAEHDNLRAALEWCTSAGDAKAGLRMLAALGWPWEVRSHYREMRSWFERICGLPNANRYTAAYARLLNHLGRYSWTQGGLDDARALLEKGQAMWAELGAEGEAGLAEGLNWLGMVVLAEGQSPEAAEACFTRSYQLYQKLGDPLIAVSIFHRGIVEIERENARLALAKLEESRQLFRQMGDLFFTARVTVFMGQLFWRQGALEKAAEHHEACLALDRQILFWKEMTSDLRELGDIYRDLGRYEQAARSYTESMALCRQHGLGPCSHWWSFGLLALRQNKIEAAKQQFMQPGKPEQLPIGFPGLMLTGMAAVAAVTGQPERAARLYGAGRRMLMADNHRLPAHDQTEVDGYLKEARGQLGEQAFERLVAEGEAMSLEQASAYAQEASLRAATDSKS